MKVVIIAGGNGTRLWPMSKKSKPKQFVKVLGNDTLFTQTIKRFDEYKNNITILNHTTYK